MIREDTHARRRVRRGARHRRRGGDARLRRDHAVVAGAASNENGNDFKALFAQYQRTPGGVSARIGGESPTHRGDNGRQFTLDLATASGTATLVASLEGTIVIESTPSTAPYLKKLLGFLQ